MRKILLQAGKGVMAGYILIIVKMVRKLVLIPMMMGFMGQSLYGIWIIIGEIMGYLRQLEGGMGFAIEQRVASIKWENNLAKLNAIYSNGLIIYFVLSLVAIIVGLILVPFFILTFKVDPVHHNLVSIVFFLSVLSMGLSLPLYVLSSFIRGVQEQAWETSIAIMVTIIGFLLVIILLNLDCGLLALPIAGLALLPFRYGYSLFLIRRAVEGISFSTSYFSKKISKNLVSFSFFAFINQISYVIIFSTDAIVIGYFIGTDRVTVYVLSFQLTLTLIGLVRGISSHLQPGFAELSSMQEVGQLRKLFIDTLRVSMVFAGLVVASVYFMNIYFVNLWVGDDHYGGQLLTIIFSLIGFYAVLRQHFCALLLSAGDVKFVALCAIIEAFLNLTFSLILVNYFGLVGVALGTLLTGIIVSVLLFIPKVLKKIEISLLQIISVIIIRPVIFSIPVGLISWFLTRYIFYYITWSNFLITGLITSCVGLLLVWFSLEINHKNTILNIIKGK